MKQGHESGLFHVLHYAQVEAQIEAQAESLREMVRLYDKQDKLTLV